MKVEPGQIWTEQESDRKIVVESVDDRYVYGKSMNPATLAQRKTRILRDRFVRDFKPKEEGDR